MDKQGLIESLKALDAQLDSALDIILIGGAAMILHFGANRATRDVDVLVIKGDPRELRRAAEMAAEGSRLPPDWINDAAKGFADILPHDFADRLAPLDLALTNLHAYFLGLPDQVAMKIVALREQDLEDLELLLPEMTEAEKQKLIQIMAHVAKFRIDWAQRIRYFLLEQGWQIE